MSTLTAGDPAPAFELATTDGSRLSLPSQLKKGPVLLAFYKSSCPVCQFTFPFLERIHKAYPADQVTVLGISQDDDRDTKDFMQEYGLTFPLAIDDRGYPASNAYGLTNVPSLFLVTPDQKIRLSSVGFSKKDIERVSRELAEHVGKPILQVFRTDEVIPEYKPG